MWMENLCPQKREDLSTYVKCVKRYVLSITLTHKKNYGIISLTGCGGSEHFCESCG